MRRLSRLPLLLAAVAALSAGPGVPARADEGERTKTFPDHNFKLTLPEKWTWDELSEVDKEAGFLLIARRTVRESVEASVWVRVTDAGSASLDSFLGQIKDAKTKELTGVVAEERSLDWAGVPARRLEISGKYEGGGSITFETYGTIVGGKFHQLDIRCTNGAEDSLRDEMNDIANGYALLKSGKPGAGQGDSDPGRVQQFPKFSLTWTLPKPSELPPAKEGERPRPVRWGFSTNNVKPDTEPGENGDLAIAAIVLDDGNPVVITLNTQKAPVGMTAQLVAQNDKNFTNLVTNFSDVPAPRLDNEVEVGNLHGASRTFVGKDKQEKPKQLYFKVHFAVLKDLLFQVVVRAHDKAEHTYREQILQALAGLQWTGAKEGIRGPVVTPFPTYTEVRPDPDPKATPDPKRDQEAELALSALSLKKPAPFVLIKFDANAERQFSTYQLAAEGRKEGVYAFVGVRFWRLKAFSDEKLTLETVIDALEIEWKNDMTDPVTLTQKGGKASKRPDSLSGAKGHAYEFRGKKDGVPYVEKGWMVKNAAGAYMVRLQYGGKDAEAAFAAETKTLLKSLKLGS